MADLRLVLDAWLRLGHTTDSSELLTFFDEAVSPLPPRPHIEVVRADFGNCANAALTHIEVRYLTYFWGEASYQDCAYYCRD